jgi:GNAT superfamily N-acetyltransferase
LVGSENVLASALPIALGDDATNVRVVLDSEPDSIDQWVDRVARGFASPDTQGIASHETYPHEQLAEVMRDFVSSEGMLRYTALLDGDAAGGGAVRYHDGIAQLCGASTLPEQRLRGVQSALLHKRLTDAANAGCELATVVTQPGSKSCENVQRKGFALLYLRSLLVWDERFQE